jgi:uncharacterized protein YecE (DUF72 family)
MTTEMSTGTPSNVWRTRNYIENPPKSQPRARLGLRHAIEIRHQSCVDLAFIALVRRHRVTLVFADSVSWPYAEDWTADFVYLRLHGSEELYTSGYSDEALDHWAGRIKLWAEGLEPNDARLIAPDTQPARQSARDVFAYSTTTRRSGRRSTRARCAHGWLETSLLQGEYEKKIAWESRLSVIT